MDIKHGVNQGSLFSPEIPASTPLNLILLIRHPVLDFLDHSATSTRSPITPSKGRLAAKPEKVKDDFRNDLHVDFSRINGKSKFISEWLMIAHCVRKIR